MNKFLIISVIISAIYGNLVINLPIEKKLYQKNNINRLIGVMVQFQEELNDDYNTSGNGRLLNNYDEIQSSIEERCNGFIIDKPPHNSQYFHNQMEAVANYYENISNENQIFNQLHVINTIFDLDTTMSYYSKDDTTLSEAFIDAVTSSVDSLSLYAPLDNALIVVFHAGVGQDFAVPFLDPTPYDLSSAYIDPDMLFGWNSEETLGLDIQHGLLLPETQNHIFYDVIEDIFYTETDFCDYQIGLTGSFAFHLGYALGIPPLYNTNTGDAGVGVFGLMDHGSNNGRGIIPSPPTAWSRIYMDWENENLVDITTDGIYTIDTSLIYKIKISDNEYFLIRK